MSSALTHVAQYTGVNRSSFTFHWTWSILRCLSQLNSKEKSFCKAWASTAIKTTVLGIVFLGETFCPGKQPSGKVTIQESSFWKTFHPRKIYPGKVWSGKKPSGKVTIRETILYRIKQVTRVKRKSYIKGKHQKSNLPIVDWMILWSRSLLTLWNTQQTTDITYALSTLYDDTPMGDDLKGT